MINVVPLTGNYTVPGKCGNPVEDVLGWILLVWDEIVTPNHGEEPPVGHGHVTGVELIEWHGWEFLNLVGG